MSPKEAETQLREIIAEADLQDARLDAFCASLPTMRTSDLFGYVADHTALRHALIDDDDAAVTDIERTKLILFAAVLAIKDQIDHRFPIPRSERSTTPRTPGRSSVSDRIILMFEHPACEVVFDVHLPLPERIIEGADAQAARVCPACPICKEPLRYVSFNLEQEP